MKIHDYEFQENEEKAFESALALVVSVVCATILIVACWLIPLVR